LTVAASCLVATIPIIVTGTPPIHDYPFHLAKIDVLSRHGSSAFLQAHYEVSLHLQPNLLGDLLGVLLAKLLPIDLAGRFLVAAILATQISGVCALHHSVWRRKSLWPLASILVAYNFILLFGFLNYLLGIGLALWALAVGRWARNCVPPVRLLVGVCGALAVYFAHLVAFGLYSVAVTAFALQAAWRHKEKSIFRQVAVDMAPLFLVLGIFVFSSTAGAGGFMFFPEGSSYLRSKLAWSLTPLLFGNLSVDLIHIGILIGAMALAGWMGSFRLHPEGTLVVLLLLATYLAAPVSAMSGTNLDKRIPVALAFFVVALTDLSPKGRTMGWSWRLMVLVGVGAVMVAVRLLIVGVHMQSTQQTLSDLRSALLRIPDGAVVFTATQGRNPSFGKRWVGWDPPIKHAVSFASLGRDVFVPATWAEATQQPIAIRPEWRNSYEAQQQNPPIVTDADALEDTIARYREAVGERAAFVLLLDPSDRLPSVGSTYEAVVTGNRFALIRILPGVRRRPVR
jgi:hypothetical protein